MTHQGRHAIHQYLLTRSYSVDCSTLKWSAGPQEALIGALRRCEADAVVLLDQFFHHGERSADVECLYTDGAAWKQLTAFDEMIKHIVAARAPLILQNPALHCALIDALHQSLAYSEQNMNEIADVFVKSYGGDREDLLASARYPRMEFTFTETERRLAQRQMEMFVEVGRLPRSAPVESFFVSPS
jgi:ABC-type nitrate/sulfonate/bicarbonate transport system substrate-binding protein